MLMHIQNLSDEKWQFHGEVMARFAELRSAFEIAFGDKNEQPGHDLPVDSLQEGWSKTLV